MWHSRNVTCRRGQATSIPLDYYAHRVGGGRRVFCVFFLVPFLFSLKTSPGGYIIYRIVNCVSVI